MRRMLPFMAAAFTFTTPLVALAQPAPPPAPAGAPGGDAKKDESPAGDAKKDDAPAGDAKKEDPAADAASEREMITKELGAVYGPAKGQGLGDQAVIDVPDGSYLVPKSGMMKFNKILQNESSPNEIGAMVLDGGGAVLYFAFEDIGYVKDDERDFDAAEMMKAMKESEPAGNASLRAQGLPEQELLGWAKEPFYSETTHSLEWATRFRRKTDKPGEDSMNYRTTRLGRGGIINIVLATEPAKMDAYVAKMNTVLTAFQFVPGKDYASFKSGDKIATIGLTALASGGAIAVLAKTGILGKIWKFLVAGVVAIGAGIARLFGRKKKAPVPATAAASAAGGTAPPADADDEDESHGA